MRKVRVPEVVTALEATESPLPAQIQEALGELVGAAREGLLALTSSRTSASYKPDAVTRGRYLLRYDEPALR